MTNRRSILPVIIVGLVAASCGSSKSPQAASSSTTTTTQAVTTTTTTSTTTTTTPGVVPAVGLRSYVATIKSPDLMVNISYPVLGGMASGQIEGQVNSQILGAVKGYVSNFQTQLDGVSPTVAPGSPGANSGPSQMSGSFTKELVDSNYVSFLFQISVAAVSAASPTTETESLTFDLKSGKLLTLSDLFSGTKYLSTLSSLARTALAAKLGQGASQSFIDGGTQPNAANFACWNLTKTAFQLTFSQGKVAPTASGVVSVALPYSQLSSISKNPGPLTNP